MMTELRSEFRKLLTVRSTYFITGLAALAVMAIGFYIEGWQLSGTDLLNPGLFTSDVAGSLMIMVVGAVVAILLMTHEYRYNTILYTLTASRSRSKVLAAKVITISVYAVFLTALIGILAPVFSNLGIHAHGHVLVPQTLHIGTLVWHSLFYGWAYSMAGLVLAVLIRSQVGAIVALFLIPGLVEGLLTQLLKHNSVYMPFTALGQVINSGGAATATTNGGRASREAAKHLSEIGSLSPGRAALVFLGYLVVVGAVAWFLFLRRDANNG
ncbi:MAG: ABC transporter permease [Candidatus Saccharimonadales bacterium]